MTSFNQRECTGCGQPCDGFYCYICTCSQCGVNLLLGTCLNCTYGDGKPVTCCGCEGPLRGGFCSFCASRDGNSFDYNPNPNSFNESQNFSDYPPQPRYETNICELCGNDAHFGYDCSLQVSFDYNQNPCFDQNFDNNFPLTSPQQYLYFENCGGPHATFQCQLMNQDFYNSNPSGFDQFQPPQFPVNYPPQETNKEILQAREDLMEAIQAFLKEYDHIPPNEKCMALLLAEERFLKIKQAVEKEQNQPEVMQELLLKLMDDLQILKGIQQEKEKLAAQSFTTYRNFSMIDDVEVLMRDIYTFLRKFSHVRNINEELSEYINCPSCNRPTFYDNDDDKYTIIYRKPKAITSDLPIEEPDNSLITGDEHLDPIPETESDEIIKSSVEILVPIPMISTPFIPFVPVGISSSSPIPVVDSDFLVEEVDTFLVFERNSILPGTDFEKMDKIKAKIDKTGHENGKSAQELGVC
ncbi:hypothetical protein Tco_0564929 [Tanacetum coccineum]